MEGKDVPRDMVVVVGGSNYVDAAKDALLVDGSCQDYGIFDKENLATLFIHQFGDKIRSLLVSTGFDLSSRGALYAGVRVAVAGAKKGIPHVHLTTACTIEDDVRSQLNALGVQLRERRWDQADGDFGALLEYLQSVRHL